MLSIILYVVAGGFFCFGIYSLLRAWLKFGEPYSSLRRNMEEVRKILVEGVKSRKYSEEETSRLVESFDRNARSLRIPKFGEDSRN